MSTVRRLGDGGCPLKTGSGKKALCTPRPWRGGISVPRERIQMGNWQGVLCSHVFDAGTCVKWVVVVLNLASTSPSPQSCWVGDFTLRADTQPERPGAMRPCWDNRPQGQGRRKTPSEGNSQANGETRPLSQEVPREGGGRRTHISMKTTGPGAVVPQYQPTSTKAGIDNPAPKLLVGRAPGPERWIFCPRCGCL